MKMLQTSPFLATQLKHIMENLFFFFCRCAQLLLCPLWSNLVKFGQSASEKHVFTPVGLEKAGFSNLHQSGGASTADRWGVGGVGWGLGGVGCTHADPGVLESLLGCDSLGRVDRQHLVDEILCFRSHRVPLGGGKLKPQHTHTHTDVPTQRMSHINVLNKRWGGGQAHVVRSGFDLLVEFVLVLIPERGVSNQEDVKDHTYVREREPWCK